MNRRFVLLPASLLTMLGACSGSSGNSTGDLIDFDAAGPAASDDGSDASASSSDASMGFGSGPTSEPGEAGSAKGGEAGPAAKVVDAGSQRLACYQPALGVCQSSLVPADGVADWDSQCKFDGGTTDPCSTTGLVGCCIGEANHYCYYSQDYTLATAQQGCSVMNGTWSTNL